MKKIATVISLFLSVFGVSTITQPNEQAQFTDNVEELNSEHLELKKFFMESQFLSDEEVDSQLKLLEPSVKATLINMLRDGRLYKPVASLIPISGGGGRD